MKNIFWSTFLLSCSTAVAQVTSSNCTAVVFTVSGTAQNRNISASIPLGTLDGLVNAFNNATLFEVSGTQTLAGTFCKPSVINANNQKLQMLFGSITANRDGWDAEGGVGTDFPEYQPERYSWVRYMNNKGYPTLAMDRLGTGRSAHPDPILVVQAPYEIALYNSLARQVRAGTTGQLPRAYNFLIYIGNSYGSNMGTGTAGADPTAYDEYVLTGYSKNVQQDFLGISLVLPLPAALVDPARFGSLPAGYLTSSSQTGRTNSFFGSKAQVDFDDTLAQLFFQRKDVVTIGQFVTLYALYYSAPEYTGRVLVLTGEQDQAYCGPGSPVIGPAGCGSLLQETGTLFPKAQYNWKSVDRVGHGIQLHIRSQTVYDIAQRFLAGESFQGGAPAK
ncbi:hypothetical protein P153DRAFT_329420 [Dothidotthia symphoricarpi CBS 119687]|uniref:Alpha/beta-hydrolase n=1 Tax=Dothidotthia symphoricarpi CBS 119687 TaxID=1392245 RepID=A0A6A6ASX2_9PLEO|nr:uncharacterized protein P153DRAFT_329420 [Dothidotthia symphoricarpi CBS 119687]KAF2134760.1 hypothetical protein P153DRAFT_329420 [Dothidotthia symphoricarpi CBS 119687]